MLSGIAIINIGYFDNTNDKLLLKIKLKFKRQCQDNIGVYHTYCFPHQNQR